MGSDKVYPKEMWWHHHLVFQLDEWGNSSPRPGQEQEFNHVWSQNERAAWTYELVRRLERMLQNDWSCNRPIPSKDILHTLTRLPPYDELNSIWQEAIAISLNCQVGIRPIAVPEALLPVISKEGHMLRSSPVKGYGLLPKVGFDLTASDEALKARFLEMINELRVEHRIESRPKNKGRPHLKVKWHNLDFAHAPEKFKCPQDNASRCRADLVKTALKHLEFVALGAMTGYAKKQPRLVTEVLLERDAELSRLRHVNTGGDSEKVFPFAEILVKLDEDDRLQH